MHTEISVMKCKGLLIFMLERSGVCLQDSPYQKPQNDHDSLLAHQQRCKKACVQIRERLFLLIKQNTPPALANDSRKVAGASNQTSDAANTMAAAMEEMSVSITHISDHTKDAMGFNRTYPPPCARWRTHHWTGGLGN